MAKSTQYVAIDSGVSTIDGRQVFFHKDKTRVFGDSALYKQCPEMFAPVDGSTEPVFESATAVPGERRA